MKKYIFKPIDRLVSALLHVVFCLFILAANYIVLALWNLKWPTWNKVREDFYYELSPYHDPDLLANDFDTDFKWSMGFFKPTKYDVYKTPLDTLLDRKTTIVP